MGFLTGILDNLDQRNANLCLFLPIAFAAFLMYFLFDKYVTINSCVLVIYAGGS